MLSHEAAAHVLAFCMISISLVTGGIAIFAFANPTEFVRWLSPLHWISRKLWQQVPKKIELFDQVVSLSLGSVGLVLTSIVCFFLGAWFITAFLNLWTSPISRWVFPTE